MNVNKAIERLLFTFQKGNKPNENDLTALKVIAEYIDNSRKQELQFGQIFSKMFIYNFWHEVLHFNEYGNTSYKFSINNIRQFLELSLESNIEVLRDRLNSREITKYANEKGVNTNHFKIDTEEQQEAFNKLSKEDETFRKLLIDGYFEKYEFEEKICNLISDLINEYKTKN